MRTVTLAKGGTGEKTVNEKVLETWHLAHDLLREVREWECHANFELLEACKAVQDWAKRSATFPQAVLLIVESALRKAEGEEGV